jgi:hypothetical protein
VKGTAPYRFGPPVDEPYFCDRDDELAFLVARMQQGINVFVLSPRRYGKSSLLERAAVGFASAGGRCAVVNLMRCTNESELAGTIASAVVTTMLSRPGRARHGLEDILRRIRVSPQVTVHPDGRAELSFGPTLSADSWVSVLEDAIDIIDDDARDNPAALILDEFQVVATIGPRGVGGTFKALADRAKRSSLVLSGSHLSVMEKLTSARGAPLQGMGERLVLDVVGAEPMTAYLIERASQFSKQLSTETATLVYATANGIPNYVQQLALAAFEATGRKKEITSDAVSAGADNVVDRQLGDFAERFENLATSQQRILRELAVRPTKSLFTKTFMDAAGVVNSNAVSKAVGVLVERELVTSAAGVRYVADPFFRRWLVRDVI